MELVCVIPVVPRGASAQPLNVGFEMIDVDLLYYVQLEKLFGVES